MNYCTKAIVTGTHNLLNKIHIEVQLNLKYFATSPKALEISVLLEVGVVFLLKPS